MRKLLKTVIGDTIHLREKVLRILADAEVGKETCQMVSDVFDVTFGFWASDLDVDTLGYMIEKLPPATLEEVNVQGIGKPA